MPDHRRDDDPPDPRLIATPDDFRAALTRLRARAGLSIRQVADELRRRAATPVSVATLGGWFGGRHLPTPKLSPVLADMLVLFGVDDEADLAAWRDALERVRPAPGPRPSGGPPPFRGLAAYGPEDADFFHGRDALTAELLDLAARSRARGRPFIVVGASGSGKSSLLRAGLIPALRRAGSRPAGDWTCVVLTPGERPLRELAGRLAATAGRLAGPRDEVPGGDAVRAALARPDRGRPLLIVVDQFEEVFTSCRDDAERSAFIETLCAAAGPPRAAATAEDTTPAGGREAGNTGDVEDAGPDVTVALGMRADFYLNALGVPALVRVLQEAQLVVGPMSEAELRQAITEPARRCGLTVEPALVEVLLRDVAAPRPERSGEVSYEAGALPLLSHALLATWEKSRSRTLTLEHYRATGGIRGAVANTAEDAFAALGTPERREIAHRLFLRLVRTDHEAVDTRRRVARADLLAGDDGAEAADVREVLDRFVAARLITVDEGGVQIVHEALLTAWPRLARWLDDDRSWRRLQHGLTIAAQGWQEAGRHPDGLYRGGMLELVRENAARHGRELTRLERDFLDASAAHGAAEVRAARRRVRRRQQFLALLAVLLSATVGTFVYARQANASERREQARALSRSVADEADRLRGTDVPLAGQLALAAYRIAPTVEARSSLLNATAAPAVWRLRGPSGRPLRSMTVSGDGRLLAAGTDDGRVRLWRIGADGRASAAGTVAAPPGPVQAVALDHDGTLLATAGPGAPLRLWRTADPARPVALGAPAGPGQAISAIALSADGRALAAASGSAVYLWRLAPSGAATPARRPAGPRQDVRAVAFTPDGRTLAAGSNDARVYLWNVAGRGAPSRLATLGGAAGQIFCLAVSADGRRLAAGTGAGHRVYRWDIGDPAHPVSAGPPLAGPASWINAVAFGPGGRTVAAGSSDGTLWLFDARTGRAIAQLPHPHPVSAVSFPSDGSVLTLAEDGTIRGWSLPGPVIGGMRDSVFALAFDASGHRLGVGPGAGDDTLSVWDPTRPQGPVQVGRAITGAAGDGRFSGSGALTPDGHTFAAGTVGGSLTLWDIRDPARPRPYGPPFRAATQLVEAVTAGPAGHTLAVSSDDGAVHLVDVRRPDRPVTVAVLRPPVSQLIYQASFSPDGRLLAAAGGARQVSLWDIRRPGRPRLLATLGGFTAEAYSTAFDGDGRVLAAGGADGTVRLWDVSDPRRPRSLGRPLTGPVGYVYSVAFAPRRDVLAGGSTDDTIWLWDLARPRRPVHLATLTGPAKGVLAVAFGPDGHTLAGGGHDRTVRLWDTSPAAAAARICATTGEPITRAEWTRYVPGRPYDPPCR